MYTRLRARIIIDRRSFTRSSSTIKSLFGDFPAATSARPVIIKAPEIAEFQRFTISFNIHNALNAPAQSRLTTPLVAVNNSWKPNYLRHYFVTRAIEENGIAAIKGIERSQCKTPRLSFPRWLGCSREHRILLRASLLFIRSLPLSFSFLFTQPSAWYVKFTCPSMLQLDSKPLGADLFCMRQFYTRAGFKSPRRHW